MATDILNGLSTNELMREIKRLVCDDQRSLPHRSKVFSAVASLQKFDVLPEVIDIASMNELISKGSIELNRGISATKGVPSQLYAKELILGSMYPGTLSALGNGIYFAVPSHVDEKLYPAFPKVSKVALKYTKTKEQNYGAGALIRAALKTEAKIADCDDLRQDLRENRNRAKLAGITDIGTFAAALGFDAYFADGIDEDADERVYTVLNRGAIFVQRQATLIKNN